MFYCGLDLGQTQNYTAAVIVDVQGEADTRAYAVRHIEQFPLMTTYPSIVRSIAGLLRRAPLAGQCTLVIDHTSVGRPVFDMFAEAQIPQLIGITITGGASWHRESVRQWHVAKILLVGTLQRYLQSGRLRIGASLPHAATLQRELKDFRVKISKSALETYEAREGQHDDLVLACSVALFAAENPGQRWVPVGE
jgi:hypothetical protein